MAIHHPFGSVNYVSGPAQLLELSDKIVLSAHG